MSFNVKFTNLSRIQSAFKAAPRQMASESQKVITQSARDVQQSAKKHVRSSYSKPPYDTGRLESQIISFFPRPLYAEIIPMVNYAIYPHEGLSTSRGYGRRPFIEDALKDRSSDIEKNLQNAAQRVFDTIARKV